MINNKLNIFQFATKELSQDAVFCYILDCYNFEQKRHIAIRFLNTIGFDYSVDISDIQIKRQEDRSDVKAVVNFADGNKKYIIIEDKVFTSIHDNQLQRYREATVKREQCRDDDVFGVFFKIGKCTAWERDACDKAHFNNLDYEVFGRYIQDVADSDILLSMFKEFFEERVSFIRMMDECDFSQLNKSLFEQAFNDRYGQRKLSEWLFKEILGQSYNEKKMYEVNNFGVPCIQYEFVFDMCEKMEEWQLQANEFPQRAYACFFRIDRNRRGPYISIRQYFRNGTTDYESKDWEHKRKSILEELDILNDDSPNRKASKEKNLLLFNVKSIEDLKKYIPQFKKAVEHLLCNS